MKRADNQPVVVDLSVYGGVFCKLFEVADTGTIIPQHSHKYDHLTLVLSGAVRVWCDDGPARDYMAPAMIRIPAGTKHLFATLESATTLACVHAATALEDGEPAVTAEHQLDLED